MVNTEDLTKRLEIILEYYSLNASSFADKIGVQRSSLSHLLSGRNKPSLDFILKIIAIFPEVDLYWILNGKGTFPKSELKEEQVFATSTPTSNNRIIENKAEKTPELLSEDVTNQKNGLEEKIVTNFINTKNPAFQRKDSEIEQIVIFYKNGTFKIYSLE